MRLLVERATDDNFPPAEWERVGATDKASPQEAVEELKGEAGKYRVRREDAPDAFAWFFVNVAGDVRPVDRGTF